MKFKDFQAPVLFSTTFKALKVLEKKFKYFQGCVGTLKITGLYKTCTKIVQEFCQSLWKNCQSQRTVDLLQVRRLTYFGHVNSMGHDRFPKLLLHGYTHGHRSKRTPKKKWLDKTISVRTVRTWIYLYYKHLISPGIRHNGETLFTTWAARARGHHHHQGHKSK